MERSPISRRTFLSLTAAGTARAPALAACGKFRPGGGSSVWRQRLHRQLLVS
ncbi:hypothetical protein [Actinoplanes nipponensis]|uniref:hypothetical protein n=1 Tax=Actinoplanes nipponensis TaxID=135950 RepID=UPI0031F01A15